MELIFQGTVYRLSLILSDTRGETTIVDAAINATAPQSAFLTGPRLLKVAEDARPGARIGHFILSNNPEMYRGVSCFIRQVNFISRVDYFLTIFSKVAPLPSATINFEVRKDLTPEDGETRFCFLSTSVNKKCPTGVLFT